MKKIYYAIMLLVIFIAAGNHSSFAISIVVSDTIHSDSTWHLADADTVKVIGDLTVADGATLTIDPGIIVEFQGFLLFSIKGTLIATGTVQDSIRFTINPDSVAKGWQGLEFKLINQSTNDTSRLEYCIVEYSKRGGIYNLNSSKLIIDHCLIRYNLYTSGSDWGAGMYIANSNPVITNNTIAYNIQTSGKGGGIYFDGGTVNKFSNNLICNNQAYTGGAIFINYATVKSVNNIFVNNTASNIAGGVFVLQSSPTFINTTIANNQADRGGGISFSLNSNSVLQNVLITGNTATSNGDNVFFYTSPATQSFSYCNIEGDSAAFAYNGAWHYTGPYVNNIDTIPGFKNATAGAGYTFDALQADWGLIYTSPIINRGNPDTSGLSLPLTDFYGNTRIFLDTVDIGAAEYICNAFTVFLGNDTVLCADLSLAFDLGTTYDSIRWMNGTSNTTLIVDSNGTGPNTLEVYVTVYSGLCSATDTILVTFDPCTGILDQNNNDDTFFIYDPVTDQLTIAISKTSGNINIYNIEGRLMKSFSGKELISVSDFAPGIYLITYDANGVHHRQKLAVN
jgi:hypothetical protein